MQALVGQHARQVARGKCPLRLFALVRIEVVPQCRYIFDWSRGCGGLSISRLVLPATAVQLLKLHPGNADGAVY